MGSNSGNRGTDLWPPNLSLPHNVSTVQAYLSVSPRGDLDFRSIETETCRCAPGGRVQQQVLPRVFKEGRARRRRQLLLPQSAVRRPLHEVLPRRHQRLRALERRSGTISLPNIVSTLCSLLVVSDLLHGTVVSQSH